MPTLLAVPTQCPKCGGNGMWDNRLTKKNPKQPDFKCKNRACDGVVWPPKSGEVYADQLAQSVSSPVVTGANYPAVVPTPNPTAMTGVTALTHAAMVTEKLNDLLGAYDIIYGHVLSLARKAAPEAHVSLEAISSMTATLWITAKEKGLV